MRRAAVTAAVLTAATVLLMLMRMAGSIGRAPQITYAGPDGSLFAYDLNIDLSAPLVRGIGQLPVAWSWSPDGSRLAYVLLDSLGSGYDLLLWTPVLRRTTWLARDLPFGSPPQWSPDGQTIAAVDLQQDICLYSFEGRLPDCLNVQPAGQPTWSPDGTAIAFLSRLPEGGLRRVDIAGRNVTPLFTGINGLNHPRWSSDGALIAFSYQPGFDGLRHLYVVPSGGGAVRALTSGSASQDQPQWSPDSAYIAYNETASLVRAQPDAAVIGIETGEVRYVTTHPLIDTDPRWSPDGRWLAFVSDRYDGRPRLHIVPTGDLAAVEPLATPGLVMRLYAFAWRP